MPTIDVDGRVYPCMVEYILELRVAVDTLEAVCRILELDTETCTGTQSRWFRFESSSSRSIVQRLTRGKPSHGSRRRLRGRC